LTTPLINITLNESNDEIDYQWEDEYLGSETFLGLVADSLPTARPMVNNVNNGDRVVENPQVIRLQFDTIAYQKSGSVMLMIRAVLGHDLWLDGLRKVPIFRIVIIFRENYFIGEYW
jgi:aminopeptidase N